MHKTECKVVDRNFNILKIFIKKNQHSHFKDYHMSEMYVVNNRERSLCAQQNIKQKENIASSANNQNPWSSCIYSFIQMSAPFDVAKELFLMCSVVSST